MSDPVLYAIAFLTCFVTPAYVVWSNRPERIPLPEPWTPRASRFTDEQRDELTTLIRREIATALRAESFEPAEEES